MLYHLNKHWVNKLFHSKLREAKDRPYR